MQIAITLLVAAAVAATATPASAAASRREKRGKVAQQGDLSWKPLSPKQQVGGPTIHVVWGDPAKGPAGILVKLPGEGTIPAHVHSADYHAVVISGTWLHSFGKEPPTEITAGGYWFQPARQAHEDRCRAGDDCVILLHTSGRFDLTPAPRVAPQR